jgi:hypothetical protein
MNPLVGTIRIGFKLAFAEPVNTTTARHRSGKKRSVNNTGLPYDAKVGPKGCAQSKITHQAKLPRKPQYISNSKQNI